MSHVTYIMKRLTDLNWKGLADKLHSLHKKTGKSYPSLMLDIQACARKYGAGYMDYDLFEMYNLTDAQRATYLTRGRNDDLVRKYCDRSYRHLLAHKDEFNSNFGDYIKRDWIKVQGTPVEDVLAFFDRHDVVMAKPINGMCGKGIQKLHRSDFASVEAMYDVVADPVADYELEELIIQHDTVNGLYAGAINTIRVVTILTTDTGASYLSLSDEEKAAAKLVPHVICAYFRIGREAFVDNFNSGGMVAPVDELSGVVRAVAIDKNKTIYETHPVTGTAIPGFQIPYWDEVLALCLKACLVVPENGYSGWDVAITPDGPVLVEGNDFPGHDIYQLPAHTPDKMGVYPKFVF